ncbi:hypothetical protein EV196_101141 [Mariniflexile fucanivorans]|uniref:Glycosyl hydrolase family 16 n=1 Tax=Mariniflexile fucanivorans TaxID=264023 RepID=A0A4R1RRY1_9FLAO|nr:hypothetical protein [Mariniflexile fucanivorans]TCL68722.1 hypothetical protein EV196_101141 [Mariniflexile fucanivorans]
MKNSIKILAAIGIVFLLSFSAQAQTDDWTGEWNTKFGKVTITKNGGEYSGFLPKGKLTQIRVQDGSLIGFYSRLAPKFDKSSLGKKGTFKFTLSADKKKFDGYHKSDTDERWSSVNWNGVKVWGMVMPVIVSNNLPTIVTPSWTGTWKSTNGDIFKILDTGNAKNNMTYVYAKISVKVDGVIKSYDVKGLFENDTPEVFEGTIYRDNGWDVGYMTIEYGAFKIDDCTGYMWFGGDTKHPISAHRTSSAKPTVKIF